MDSNKTEEMFKLGQAVFLEGIQKLKECKQQNANFIHNRSRLIIKKRLAVVEFTHGLELILKAVLVRRGYSINRFKNGIFREEQRVKDIVNPERTIDLEDVTRFFSREFSNCPFRAVDKLRELRNQIIHRGTQIDEKKREYFIGAIDCLVAVYGKEAINHRTFLREIEQSKNEI
jgi:hypothetical protein